ncbi:MAG: hypothetical protein R3C68_15445 [Myxococcota bacterium]
MWLTGHDLEEMLSIPLRAEAALRTGFGVEGGAQHGNHIGLDVNAGGVYQLTEPLGIFASVGTSPNSAVGTADFRMMAGCGGQQKPATKMAMVS